MSQVHLGALALVLLLGTPPAAAQRASGQAAEVQALAAAWAEAERARLPIAGHTIVLRPVGNYIVVSASSPCSVARRCYGGRSHFVYSPAGKRIVHVVAED
jgi:hypothetical protein